jgi:hypothetical protein
MATLTISTALAADITDSLTYRTEGDSIYEYAVYQGFNNSIPQNRASIANYGEHGSLFGSYRSYDGGGYNYMMINTSPTGCKFEFQNSSGLTLTKWQATEIVSRTIDANGYCVLSNFIEKIPTNAGTIDKLVITSGTYDDNAFYRTITLSIGPTGSGADIEFDDRALVTNQPWRLDTAIKFRIPMEWNWTT